jgi:ribonuclease HI
MFTDAPGNIGWGAALDDLEDSEPWNEAFLQEHINYLELMAIWLGLRSFLPHTQNKVVQVYSDNQTAVAYMQYSL